MRGWLAPGQRHPRSDVGLCQVAVADRGARGQVGLRYFSVNERDYDIYDTRTGNVLTHTHLYDRMWNDDNMNYYNYRLRYDRKHILHTTYLYKDQILQVYYCTTQN